MRILLAEDDVDTIEFIETCLVDLDHVVSSAGCGEQALLLACSSPWDVIILDRMLPELDGLTLLRTLRGRGVMTPVLMLTGRHLKVCAPDNDLADIMRTLAMPRV